MYRERKGGKEKRGQGGMFLEREEEGGECQFAWKQRKREYKMKKEE